MSPSNGDARPLKKIGQQVYVSNPATEHQDAAGPRYIILFGWMGGQLPHLQKYLDKYTQLYPNATQILVRSHPSFFFSRHKTRESLILPAAQILRDGMAQDPSAGVLVHTFSNGGAAQFLQLSHILAKQRVDPSPKPHPTCIIFDSAPGRGDIFTAIDAFTIHVKSSILKLLAWIAMGSWLFFYMLFRMLRGKQSPVDEIRVNLNNPTILPWTTAKTPRLYLYSDSDRLIPHEAVEEHVALARTAGLNARGEMFHGSPHVAHARAHPEKYWAAVAAAWAEARKISEQ